MNDNVLGILLHVTLGIKQVKDRIQFAFYEDQVGLEEQLDIALLAKEKLLEVKRTLSPRTLIEGNDYKTLLRQKADEAIVASSHHSDIRDTLGLREQAQKLERFLKYLKEKYGEDKNIEYDDTLKITKDFPEIKNTFFLCLSFSSDQIERLKNYLKKYYKQYADRDLDRQDRLALPDIYAQAIISKVNTQSFINTYGRKRVAVNKNNSLLFCHSAFHLQRKGIIKIRDIELVGTKVNSVTIDNLITEAIFHQEETRPKPISDLQERYKQLLNKMHRGNKHTNFKDRYNKTLKEMVFKESKPPKLQPSYEPPNILFQGKSIPITANTYQDSICSIAFKNKVAMTKQWSWDEIFEERGELNPEKGWWRKIYMAGREINDKIAIQTGIKDLLIVKKRTIAVNPKYLK